ncbi:Domain of uncharacterised function (DUF3846) [Slackia heliotrinireducens]|uniref:DUF3846 domain-containing protein n=1 Tax=Slackia heliotrinireducens (strain ATCC 29202 / DSM 20476 / NCTC 11029 / RHS 1) TaxID=471855 RepID=C7N824_SLAHD|nr:DUF3846 domain-containing protein [Slackia heliotrinireducens]ACV23059.1 hypothetical protein Shel_20470 [Slackia heliotrinireducens DSM 20476]VEH02009.1 Domain of uncharacterised function (DUF3846) [Slackia heliotrinireducens]
MTRALLIPVDDAPRPVDVDGLRDLQRLVGGDIEAVGWVFDDAPTIYVNESGKFDGLPPNRAIFAEHPGTRWDGSPIRVGDLLDVLYGPIVAVGFDPATGEDRDINDAEAARIMSRFGENSIGSGLLATLGVRLVARYAE